VLVLSLDTATPASTAALVEVTPETITGVAERRTVDARAHGEKLAPEIAAALAEAGVRAAELGAIVAGVGPGPFTGLRVGLATAASMGQALGIPTYGVCSLDALGRAAGPGRVLVATDARRREVYHATYLDGVRLIGPDVAKPVDVARAIARAIAVHAAAEISESEVVEAVSSLAGADGARLAATIAREDASETAAAIARVGRALEELAGVDAVNAAARVTGLVDRAAGEGALKYAEVFGVPVEEHLLYPPGAALVALAAPRIRAAAPSEPLTPLYLRRPDAVEPAGRKPVLT
jgi:tRNA threonylcarbamoyl adenosine modification protein YeaZ